MRRVTDRPIIMSGGMVNAIMREVREPGTGKTETRRLLYSRRKMTKNGPTVLMQHTPDYFTKESEFPNIAVGEDWYLTGWHARKPGDRLWVRENFSGPWSRRNERPADWNVDHLARPIWYWADGNPDDGDWTKPKPSIHMPRWASRLTLIVTDVRIERLQGIDEAAAKREGAELAMAGVGPYGPLKTYRTGFVRLWGSLHGTDSWLSNPWVARVTFRPVLANIDSHEVAAA